MKPLILFYSYSGNTRQVAELIGELTGGDLAAVETVTPYPADYNAVVDQAKQEIQASYQPEVKPLSLNPADYDTLIIGSPAWWYTCAPALKAVLSGQDWTGKTVYPFATHGGGPGKTVADIGGLCSSAQVKPGLELYYSGAGPRDLQKQLTVWLSEL